MRHDDESRKTYSSLRDVVSAWAIWGLIMLGLLGWWALTVSAVHTPDPVLTGRTVSAVDRVGPGPAVPPWTTAEGATNGGEAVEALR